MPLSSGDQLGPYEILAPLGAGGMGVVFKARDTRLARIVAIKVLPEHIAKRADLRARFEREARVVASLNHPHICTLHDIGNQDGTGYMVMELIEGETLAARIAKGALPLDQALKFAIQIADALDRAHRAGVTHRDVKPQNIMLTRDGVKVLDFGLAKSAAPKPGPTVETVTQGLTAEGAVVGTPQYMAPEQFEGLEADARSDIWAFGAVLYEMLTGKRAFQGKSYPSLVGAILSTNPLPMTLQPETPAWLERLVERCLAKDPEDRWQTMRDVVIEMRRPPKEAAAAGPSKVVKWQWVLLGVFALAFVLAGFGWYTAARPGPPRPLIRLNAEIPIDTPLARVAGARGVFGNMLALSPDGTRVAVTLRGADGKIRLHTRLLNQNQFVPLAGTENAHSPFFSPAGDWLGFFAEGKLKKIPVEGGTAVTLCAAPSGFGGSWGDDGNIIAALDWVGVLSKVPSAGGTPVAVTKLRSGEISHRWPQMLPGGQTVLFSAGAFTSANPDDANIELISLQSGERKTILSGGYYPRFLAGSTGSSGTGHLAYLHQSTLLAVPFHLGRMAPVGAPVPILEDVIRLLGAGNFAFSRDGTFVYLTGKEAPEEWLLSWMDSSGKIEPMRAPPGRYFSPTFSPDGKRIAFSIFKEGQTEDIFVFDRNQDSPTRLSFLPGANHFPVWTPDGKHIVFRSDNPADPGLFAIRSDGSGAAKRLAEGKALETPHSFSPDGKRLAVYRLSAKGHTDIFTRPVDADATPGGISIRLGEAQVFLATPSDELHPAFSPDGHWLAYTSNESGTSEVYVRPFPEPGGRWQISAGGGRLPLWSRDGHELLFETLDQRLMAISYTANDTSFAAGKTRPWTDVRLRDTRDSPNYDLAPGGKLWIASIAATVIDEKAPTSLTFLLNFFDELRRKAPLN